MSSSIKFGTHHFPVGTLFTVDKTIKDSVGKNYEVKKVIRNGYNSYILETTTPNMGSSAFIELNMMHSFNISYVAAIQKRGTGPLVIQQDIIVMDNNVRIASLVEEQNHYREVMKKENIHISKNDIVIPEFSAYNYIWLYTEDATDKKCTSIEIIEQMVLSSSVFKKVYIKGEGHFFIIKKKSFKHWIKQNKNRFLTNVEKQQKKYDDIMYSMDERQFDDELEYDIESDAAIEEAALRDDPNYSNHYQFDDSDFESLKKLFLEDIKETTEEPKPSTESSDLFEKPLEEDL